MSLLEHFIRVVFFCHRTTTAAVIKGIVHQHKKCWHGIDVFLRRKKESYAGLKLHECEQMMKECIFCLQNAEIIFFFMKNSSHRIPKLFFFFFS